MKILIIEQEKTIRESLFNFLDRSEIIKVFTAPSRQEGMSLFETIPFDVVLCGHVLPDGNGLEILKELLARNPKLTSILMTVQNDEFLKREALKAGVRSYLEKPFDLKQLEEALGIAP